MTEDDKWIHEYFVIHAPGWPGGYSPVPQTLEAGRRFVDEHGGTLRIRKITQWKDDER